MSEPESLGELEQIVMLVVLRLGDEAYSASIRDELEARAGRSLSLGTLYVTLSRLERKGMLASSLGDPTPVRGGRAKRFYRGTPRGVETLRRAKRTLQRLWDGVELETYASGESS